MKSIAATTSTERLIPSKGGLLPDDANQSQRAKPRVGLQT